MVNPNVFIGMDVVKRRPVLTDKNPHVEGLQDVHKCIYLPSSMDKNQYLPNYLNQNILFMVNINNQVPGSAMDILTTSHENDVL